MGFGVCVVCAYVLAVCFCVCVNQYRWENELEVCQNYRSSAHYHLCAEALHRRLIKHFHSCSGNFVHHRWCCRTGVFTDVVEGRLRQEVTNEKVCRAAE